MVEIVLTMVFLYVFMTGYVTGILHANEEEDIRVFLLGAFLAPLAIAMGIIITVRERRAARAFLARFPEGGEG